MIHQSRTILIFQYHCQNMMAVLYFTWPAWTQGPPRELQSYTYYCEAHLLCMFFSHTGTPKHEHLPIIPTRRAERRGSFQNWILTRNNSCSVQGARPSTAPRGIHLIHIDTFLAVDRERVFRITSLITVSSLYKTKGQVHFHCSFHHQVHGTKARRKA